MWTNPDVARALAARVAEERAEAARALTRARRARSNARALTRAIEIMLDECYGALEAPYAAMALVLEASSASRDERGPAGRAALFG
jgi:hypothetical protein